MERLSASIHRPSYSIKRYQFHIDWKGVVLYSFPEENLFARK